MERRQGQLLGGSETPSHPSSPNSAQGKQIFEKFTQTGTGGGGCGWAVSMQAWLRGKESQVILGRPEELTLPLTLLGAF